MGNPDSLGPTSYIGKYVILINSHDSTPLFFIPKDFIYIYIYIYIERERERERERDRQTDRQTDGDREKQNSIINLYISIITFNHYRLANLILSIPIYTSEKAMAPHSSTLAWKIPQQRSLVGCSPWGR